MPGTAGTVTLLGDGSLGTRRSAMGDDQRISLNITNVSNNNRISGMAWAVIDESTKVRVDLYQDTKTKSWANVARAGSPPVEGVGTLRGWDEFKVRATDAGKLISLSNVSLHGGVSLNNVSVYHPDVTVYSHSLMTNPVNSGLKKDLSMFCSRGLSAAEKSMRLYKSSAVVSDAPSSDPFLSLMANYHQLYRNLGVADGNLQPGSYQVAARLPAGHNPYVVNVAAGAIAINRTTPAEPLLVPSVVRIDMIFSMIVRRTHGPWRPFYGTERPYLLHMQYLPVVTLHNPYSVPLVFDGMKVSFRNLPVGFNFMVDGQNLSTRLVALNQMYSNFAGSDTATKDFGINLKSSVDSSSSFLTLEPGQTKLFGTPKVSPNWTWFDEHKAGADGSHLFDWRKNNRTSLFNMAPTMITPPTGGGAGFDIDWINPAVLHTPKGTQMAGGARGMVALKGTETLGVQFGPYAPPDGNGSFSVSIDLLKNGSTVKAGAIEIKYGTVERLNEILSKGTSIRFPNERSFPEIFPKPGVDPPFTGTSIYEDGSTPLKDYVKSKQFMIFSLAAKTTLESFIPSKTMLAGNPTSNVAIIDLNTQRDPEGGVPLEMVMMPIRAGNTAIDENRALEEGYFFGGNGSLNGTSRATFYEFPLAPLQSLAQFRHANLAGSGFMPFVTYTAGESMAHPQIGTNQLRQNWTDGTVMLDHTFLANEALWDQYFLSTVADQSGPLFGTLGKSYSSLLTEFFSGQTKLLNERFIPFNSGDIGVPAAVAETGAGNPSYQKLAAFLLLSGGFNVNSTSVDAWKAVLAAMDEADIETVLGVDPGRPDSYAVLRVRRPSDKSIEGDPLPTRQKRWQGYRMLSNSQIEELAREMVTEVRTRGPFLSLADFVNRSVGDESELTVKGAVQAAIDRTSINNSMRLDGKELVNADVGLNGYKSIMAGTGNTASHAPGFVTQGDVLSSIGSRITVRADTFRIRGYGEARDSSGRQVLAKAWCEAIVQRVPDFVDPSDPSSRQYSALNDINKKFGRRYHIVSFRWLAQNEV